MELRARRVAFRAGVTSVVTAALVCGPVASATAVAPQRITDQADSRTTAGTVTGLIVSYLPGVDYAEAPGLATGARRVAQTSGMTHAPELLVGQDIGAGMRSVVFSHVVDEATAREIARVIGTDSRVAWAEPDLAVTIPDPAGAHRRALTPREGGETILSPNDPYYVDGSLWGLRGQYGIRASAAWTVTRGDPSLVVAVVDSGQSTHPDLVGQTVPGYDMISSPGTALDGNGRDPDPTNMIATDSHGLHVAGTINAISDNGIGVVGVAPRVKVQHVRVLGRANDGTVAGTTSDIAAGVIWASGGSISGVPRNATPARVINLSLGIAGPCTNAEQAAIDAAVSRGAVVVAAAGNDSASAGGQRPANCRNLIVVGAIGKSGRRASFSNYGPAVDIAAPGQDVMSTALQPRSLTPIYASESGTSMAAPHVSGVVALMLSTLPGLTPAQVEARIKAPGMSTPFRGGVCDDNATRTCGVGIIDAGKLLGARFPDQPFGVTVTGTPDGTSAVVAWAEPVSRLGLGFTATAFASAIGGLPLGSCSTATLTCTITGLPRSDRYFVSVRAENPDGVSEGSPRVSQWDHLAPPTRVTLVSRGLTTARIEWRPPVLSAGQVVTGYIATAYADTDGTDVVATCSTNGPDERGALGCTLTGLDSTSSAHVDVYAIDRVGRGLASGPRVLAPAIPAPPTAVVARGADRSLVVSWRPATETGADPESYLVQVIWAGDVAGRCVTTALRCTIGDLVNGRRYNVRVLARNDSGASGADDVVGTPTAAPARPPGPPTSVTAVAGAASAAISWNAPVSDGGSRITRYRASAFVTATGGPKTAGSCTATKSTGCTISGLINGRTYFVEVVAISAADAGPPSTPRVPVTPGAVPGAPIQVGWSSGDGRLQVFWNPPASDGGSAIVSYRVGVHATATGIKDPAGVCVTVTPACDIAKLPPGRYYIAIEARNAYGWGPATDPRVQATVT